MFLGTSMASNINTNWPGKEDVYGSSVGLGSGIVNVPQSSTEPVASNKISREHLPPSVDISFPLNGSALSDWLQPPAGSVLDLMTGRLQPSSMYHPTYNNRSAQEIINSKHKQYNFAIEKHYNVNEIYSDCLPTVTEDQYATKSFTPDSLGQPNSSLPELDELTLTSTISLYLTSLDEVEDSTITCSEEFENLRYDEPPFQSVITNINMNVETAQFPSATSIQDFLVPVCPSVKQKSSVRRMKKQPQPRGTELKLHSRESYLVALEKEHPSNTNSEKRPRRIRRNCIDITPSVLTPLGGTNSIQTGSSSRQDWKKKNNEASKKSREKRKKWGQMLEQQYQELEARNKYLKATLAKLEKPAYHVLHLNVSNNES